MSTQGFDASEFVKSKWLHGADLPAGQPIEMTIATVGVHEFDDGTKRPKVEFLEADQALSLNKTQTGTMIALFGANTAAWIGQRVTLTAVPTQFAGKPTIVVGRAVATMPTFNGQPMAAAAPQPPAADNPWTQPTAPVQAGVTFRQGA